MSEQFGLAGLLAAMQPKPVEVAEAIDLEAVRADGYAAGFAAGQAAEQAELAPLRLHLAAAAAAFQAACNIDGDALRPLLAELTGQIAEAVIMAEFARDPAVLARLIDAALALVRPAETATLRANPATLALLQPQLGDLVVAADAALDADEFVVTGSDFVIEAGLRARLAEIMGAAA